MGLDCKDSDGIVQSQACMLSHLPTTVFFLLRHALFFLYSFLGNLCVAETIKPYQKSFNSFTNVEIFFLLI